MYHEKNPLRGSKSESTSHNNNENQILSGEAFVARRFEPKNQETSVYVEDLARFLGLVPSGRMTSDQKIIYCLSDVLVAAMTSLTGRICWPMDAALFTGSAYGRTIALRVNDALKALGLLEQVQKPVWGRNPRSAVFLIDKSIAPDWLQFREHKQVPVIEVRDAKPDYYHRYGKAKGKRLNLSRFKGQYEPLRDQMTFIVQAMGKHPLAALMARHGLDAPVSLMMAGWTLEAVSMGDGRAGSQKNGSTSLSTGTLSARLISRRPTYSLLQGSWVGRSPFLTTPTRQSGSCRGTPTFETWQSDWCPPCSPSQRQ
jgi:hypothetical protein